MNVKMISIKGIVFIISFVFMSYLYFISCHDQPLLPQGSVFSLLISNKFVNDVVVMVVVSTSCSRIAVLHFF